MGEVRLMGVLGGNWRVAIVAGGTECRGEPWWGKGGVTHSTFATRVSIPGKRQGNGSDAHRVR